MESMSDRRWKYGDIVRVDPEKNPQVAQPDDRRWMIVAARRGSNTNLWALAPLDKPDVIVHLTNMYGFCRVEPDE